MEKVFIVPDISKVEAYRTSFEVEKQLIDHSILPLWYYESEHVFEPSDFAVLLGGDGFIMRKSLELGKVGIPFLAINFGQKGFLAVAKQDNWQEVLKQVLDGKYTTDRRPILSIRHFNAANKARHFEVAGNVYIRHKAYLILFTVSIDGKIIHKELGGDGVIVANATGATAYNLAARGALISSGLVITPISPHRLDVVSLPVPKSAKKIEIVYHGRNGDQYDDEGCLLFLDSEKHTILPGERLEIRESKKEASFIIPEGFSFIESLQEKLGLSK